MYLFFRNVSVQIYDFTRFYVGESFAELFDFV